MRLVEYFVKVYSLCSLSEKQSLHHNRAAHDLAITLAAAIYKVI